MARFEYNKEHISGKVILGCPKCGRDVIGYLNCFEKAMTNMVIATCDGNSKMVGKNEGCGSQVICRITMPQPIIEIADIKWDGATVEVVSGSSGV